MTTGSASKIKGEKTPAPFVLMRTSKSVSQDKLIAIIDVGQRYFAQELQKLEDLLKFEVNVRDAKFREPKEYLTVMKNCTFRSNSIRSQLEMVKKLALASAGSVTGKNSMDGKDLANALVNAAKEKLRAKFNKPEHEEYVGEFLADGITPFANSG